MKQQQHQQKIIKKGFN